jgi:hypothetical protein
VRHADLRRRRRHAFGAGLGLPIVCLFGNSGAQRWRPWGVPYRLLQKPSADVADIGVGEVVAAFNALRADIPARALEALLDFRLGATTAPPAIARDRQATPHPAAAEGLAMRSLGWGVGKVDSLSARSSS